MERNFDLDMPHDQHTDRKKESKRIRSGTRFSDDNSDREKDRDRISKTNHFIPRASESLICRDYEKDSELQKFGNSKRKSDK